MTSLYYASSVLILVLLVPLSSESSSTFYGNENFITYPEWIASPQRLLRFTFQTSELNGLLLYTGSSDGAAQDYLLVRLVNGSLVVNLSLQTNSVQGRSLGWFLNDNQPHTLTVYHNPNVSLFEYMLDSIPAVEEPYIPNLIPRLGTGGVFIGGIPSNAAPFANETHFVGCLESVLFASAEISGPGVESSALQAVEPTGTVGRIMDGCEDPCAGKNCNSGECVSRWPNRTFCDCQGTMMLGEDCSEGELD